jgi:hypothetical protein
MGGGPMTKIYGWNRKSIFAYFPMVVPSGLISIGFPVLFSGLLQGKLTIAETSTFMLVLFGIVMGMVYLLMTLFLIIIILPFLFGYLKISPAGFEYQRWPFIVVRGGFDQIEIIQQGTLNLNYLGSKKYATMLIRRTKPGKEFLMGSASLGSAHYHIVPLSELAGWEDGDLEATLKTYAPHAFVDWPICKDTVTCNTTKFHDIR